MEKLPLDEKDVLRLLLHREEVCREALQYLKSDAFSNIYYRWLFEKIRGYFDKYGRCFSKRAFLVEVEELENKFDYIQALEGLYELGDLEGDLEFIVDKILQFIRKQRVIGALRGAIMKVEEKDIDGAEKILQESILSQRQDIIRVYDWKEEWGKRQAERKSLVEKMDSCIVLPVMISDDYTDFDKVLGGGVWGGELASVFAPTKRGKSVFLVHIAFAAFLFGKRNVVYVTLESGVDLVLRRMDSRFLNLEAKRLKLFELTEEEIGSADEKFRQLGAYTKSIKVVEFDRGCTVVDLVRLLRKLEVEGFCCECLIVDYADIMSPVKSMGNKVDDLVEVFWDLKQLAREKKIVVWTAMQATAGSAKKKVLGWEDTADSKGRVRVLDILFSLNQTDEEKLVDVMRIGLPINRDGMSGMYVTVSTDLERMRLMR